MRVLVTGGAGFIGSHIVDALVRRGDRVRVLDNLSMGDLRNLDAVSKKIEFLRGDIRDKRMTARALRGIEVVFHQAALRSVPKSVGNPVEYHETNTTATLQLLKCAHENKIRRVVFSSSSSVYGEKTPLPQKETFMPSPQSPYAASKLAGEVYCRMFTRLYGLETICLRYFNVFGPRQSLENQYAVVVPKFITSLLSGKAPPIHGDGRQTRDFTYVENVVQANLKAASAPKAAAGEVFNIASGRRYSVRHLASSLNKKMGSKISPLLTPKRPGDVLHTWADVSKAERLLRFRVTVPFSEGLDRTVGWFQSHREVWE